MAQVVRWKGRWVEMMLCGFEKARAQTEKRFLFFYVSRGGNVGSSVGKRMFSRAETYGSRTRDVENERADGGMDREFYRNKVVSVILWNLAGKNTIRVIYY